MKIALSAKFKALSAYVKKINKQISYELLYVMTQISRTMRRNDVTKE